VVTALRTHRFDPEQMAGVNRHPALILGQIWSKSTECLRVPAAVRCACGVEGVALDRALGLFFGDWVAASATLPAARLA
jgi:hypothetical protein